MEESIRGKSPLQVLARQSRELEAALPWQSKLQVWRRIFLSSDNYAAFAAVLFCNAAIMLSKINLPSALPRISSLARSGCGMSAATLRRSLQMPAMFCSEPFGFAVSVNPALASQY